MADLFKLRAPEGATSFFDGGVEYEVHDGIVEVPAILIPDLTRFHGYKLPEEKEPVPDPVDEHNAHQAEVERQRQLNADDEMLVGSSVQPATLALADGSSLQLGEVVREAYKASGIESVKAWNALPDGEREAFIAAAVEGIEIADGAEEK